MSSAIPTSTSPASVSAPTAAAAAASVAAATAAAGATDAIAVSGQALLVTPGQALAARVLSVQAGQIELALAGGLVTAASDLPLEPGQTLRLVVDQAGAERVTLRIAPEAAPGAGSGGGSLAAPSALAQAGVPPSASSALLATMAEEGLELPTGAAATALAARAAQAGVQTPAQAAAFVRLAAAGLPTTPAAVAGLAQLMEGAPLGRALTTLIDAAASRIASEAAARSTGAGPAGGAAVAQPQPIPGPATPGGTAGMPAGPATTSTGEPGLRVPASIWTPAGGPIAQQAAPQPLAHLVDAIVQATRGIESGSVDGRAQVLRAALAELGVGMEARLAGGSAPERPPLRSLLLSLADHPATDASLGRTAALLSDTIAAQNLAGPALTAATSSAAAGQAGGQAPDNPAQNGAYLQVPLPGGGTAEVRVSPDAGRDAEGREGAAPRRMAFLLHLSALGPVMIDASAGPTGVDATVRVSSDEVRSFLSTRAAELAEGLRRHAPSAAVRVEKLAGPAPERLLAPPPSSGLDTHA